jgi:hypothetical protein
MRFLLACLVAVGFMVGAAELPIPGATAVSNFAVAAQEIPSEVDVDIDADGGGAWYANPIWIAIGVIALIAVIALVATASRGGTTVVKD